MPAVAISSISPLAAEAGARIAAEGGNAADAAVAGALVSATTAPGMCSLGGAGFAIACRPGAPPEALDGGFEMPGRGLPPERFGGGRRDAHLGYAGGVDTTVGAGSVATPGALALCSLVAERHGRLPWARLVQPAYELARDGFPLPAAAHEYLTYAHESIFGWNEDSFAALHDETGRLLPPEAPVHVPHLAASLARIAEEGVATFYTGELGRRIADYIGELGGILTARDLSAYRAIVRRPLPTAYGPWEIATNPPPAVGGAVLTAMLELMGRRPGSYARPGEDARPPHHGWYERLARVQAAVLLHRSRHLDASDDLETEVRRLLDLARGGVRDGRQDEGDGGLLPGESGDVPPPGAGCTVHTSAVDDDGRACAITLSDGYGSGAIAPGTGIWLNNCLGEPELNPHGYHGWSPGHRLISNMAPTVARHVDGPVLAIGSPGADRITTALLQVLLAFFDTEMTLQEAVDLPRLHVELTDDGPRAAYEPGIPGAGLSLPSRPFDERSMFFGGVAAAVWSPGSGFQVGSDERRGCGGAVWEDRGPATTAG